MKTLWQVLREEDQKAQIQPDAPPKIRYRKGPRSQKYFETRTRLRMNSALRNPAQSKLFNNLKTDVSLGNRTIMSAHKEFNDKTGLEIPYHTFRNRVDNPGKKYQKTTLLKGGSGVRYDEKHFRRLKGMLAAGYNFGEISRLPNGYDRTTIKNMIYRYHPEPDKFWKQNLSRKRVKAPEPNDEHLAYARELKSKTREIPHPWKAGKTITRQPTRGYIATELNKRFGTSYNIQHIKHYEKAGLLSLDGSKPPAASPTEPVSFEPETRSSDDHVVSKLKDLFSQGHSYSTAGKEIGKTRGQVASLASKHGLRAGGKAGRPVGSKKKTQIEEMNDNVVLTHKDWVSKVALHEKKAEFHGCLAAKTPEGSAFKKMHQDLHDYHEHELNRALFQLRKSQILEGMK